MRGLIVNVVEAPPRRRWLRWPFAVVLWTLAAAMLLGGCLPPDPAEESTSDRWKACAAACAPALMARAEYGVCSCFPAEGACSVDRLLVTPVPAGVRKGSAR